MSIKPLLFYTFLCLAALNFSTANAQQNKLLDNELMRMIPGDFKDAAAQYRYFKNTIPADQLPRSLYPDGKLWTSGSEWWCSGFYPGTLLYIYENTKDQSLYKEALDRLKLLEKEQYNKTTH